MEQGSWGRRRDCRLSSGTNAAVASGRSVDGIVTRVKTTVFVEKEPVQKAARVKIAAVKTSTMKTAEAVGLWRIGG
jgi:hypothetical protein